MKQQRTRRSRRVLGTPRPQLAARNRLSIAEMESDEMRAWIGSTRDWFGHKMARERSSLDRRAARGMSTPTDDASEDDQLREADLLEMLTECERGTWRIDA